MLCRILCYLFTSFFNLKVRPELQACRLGVQSTTLPRQQTFSNTMLRRQLRIVDTQYTSVESTKLLYEHPEEYTEPSI